MKLEQVGKVKNVEKVMEQILNDVTTSKSNKMKELFRLGLEVKDIAVKMDVRYNFVYNVVSNMVIMEGLTVANETRNSKKDQVWKMLDDGKTVKEIAVELKTNMQYVYKMNKEWKQECVRLAEQASVVQPEQSKVQ